MKTFLLSLTAIFVVVAAKAQFTENFDNGDSVGPLSAKCWQFVAISHSSDGVVTPINGNGSLYSAPPVSAASTRNIGTPYLNINSTSFTVSFNYMLSGNLNGAQTRTIEVGLQDTAGVFTSLNLITLDKNSPTTVQNFNQTFTLASTCIKRLVVKLGGNSGGGSVRLIFDDLSASANANYGNSSPCNSAPIAVDDVFLGTAGQPFYGNVLTNDNEPNGETMVPSVVATSPDGTVVLNSDGSFSFTPNASFTGSSTTFTYQSTDHGYTALLSNIATVTINFASNSASLPVKLISFNAKYNKPDVTLTWSTAQEKSFSHFEIEYSTDGKNFKQAAIIFGAGESDSRKDYTYTDKNITLKGGLVYYRLRSVDVDGKATYSSIRIIRIGEENSVIGITTYPNPVSNELRVTIPAEWQNKKVVYEILTANGQVTKKSETANSSQTESLNVSSLARGLYFVIVSCDGQTAQQKVIKN